MSLSPLPPSVRPLAPSGRPSPPSRPVPRLPADATPLPVPSRPVPKPPLRPTPQSSPGVSLPSVPQPPRRGELEPMPITTQVLGTVRLDHTLDSTTALHVPGATPAMTAAVPIEPRMRAARELLEELRGELQGSPKPLRAGRLHFECARLLESPLGELKDAAEGYLRAHALLGDHLPAIRGARRALLALGRSTEALPLFDAELKLTAEPDRKAQLAYEKGCLLEDVLGQKAEARAAFESSLELGKGDATRIKGTERAETLAGGWDGLSRALEREANAIESDPRHRAAIVAARARLAEARRGDSTTATELYQRALADEPQTLSALHALKRLHYSHGRWRDLIFVLEREAELATDPGVRALSYYRVGRLWLDRLGQIDEGVRALERAAEESPADPMILEELALAYSLGKKPAELARVLEKISDVALSPAERLGHYQRIAELYETALGDEARAIVWYERARALDRGHVPVLQALSKLYTQKADYAKLAEVHEGEAESVPDASRRAAAHARIAELYELRLKRTEEAVQHHARALGILPGYAPSFKALARLYAEASRYPELVELYERAVDRAADAETKVTYLYKIGRLYEDALGSPEQALVAYRRVLEIAPQEISALHSVQRSAERAGLHQELISALELEAERTTDRRRKLELLHRAGEVAETELRDEGLAVSLFKRLVELDKAYAPGYSSLGRLFYKAGRWEELLETYKSELRLLTKGPGLAALLFKMGRIYEDQLARDEDAIQCYRRAVEADPGHRAALRALAHKLGDKGLHEELVKLLEVELGGIEDAKLRARTALRIGEVYENRLRAPDKALAAYDQALAADPDLTPARDGRIRLLSEARDYKQLVEELEREAAAQRDGHLALAALLRAGEVWRDDLRDSGRAVRAFESVLERDPSHVEALIALEALYAERGSWEALGGVYSAEARVLSDPSARVGALRELGRLHAGGKVESADRGRQAFGAILQLAPTDIGALAALERIALQESDAGLLANVDAKFAAVLSDPVSVAVHETRLGELLEAVGDPQALDVYRAALARDPDSIGAARGVSRIAEKTGDPSLMEEAAEREARVHVDPARAASALVRAAERQAAAGAVDRAVQALTRALEIEPGHERAAARLAELLGERGEIDRLLALLTQAAGAAKKPDRIASLWVEVADLQANRKRDLPAGLAALERALLAAPSHVATLLKLAELYARDGQWALAVERLRSALGEKLDPDATVEANLRLAAILDEHVGDAAGALRHLDAVLAADPDHKGALERLVTLQARQNQIDRAAETAQRLVRVSSDATARVVALTLLGRLERQRGQFEAATHAYEQAVILVGMDGPPASELRELIATPRPGESPAYSRYVGALVRYAEGTPRPSAGVFFEIARVLTERMNQPEQAIGWLERGLAIYPDDASLRAELAERLLRSGQHQRALAELGKVVAADVGRESAWRQMAEAFQASQKSGEAALAVAPLVALGSANDLERTTWSLRTPRAAQAAPGSFAQAEFASIAAEPRGAAPEALLVALGDIAGKVHPPELDRWSVGPRDRVGTRSGNAVRGLADRIAAIFGLGDYDLYVHRAHNGLVEVELTDPVSVLVPAYVTGLSEPEQTFLLGRVLANASRGLAAVDRLAPSTLESFLAAAARLIDPAYTASGADEEYLAQQARRVSKALPWLGRGPIEEAARAFALAPKIDVPAWLAGVRKTAARAALVVADDLPTSYALVQRLEGDRSGAEGLALAQASELAHDLVRFWVSEPALQLRRRLGLG